MGTRWALRRVSPVDAVRGLGEDQREPGRGQTAQVHCCVCKKVSSRALTSRKGAQRQCQGSQSTELQLGRERRKKSPVRGGVLGTRGGGRATEVLMGAFWDFQKSGGNI